MAYTDQYSQVTCHSTFELHIAICLILTMPRKRMSRQHVSAVEYDEIMLNAYDAIERIESGDVKLGVTGFRVCIDGICYVRCIFRVDNYMIMHAFRTNDADTTEIARIDTSTRSNVFTSAFRASMLNIDHAIKLIKLRLISITSYSAIVDKVYNNEEYYKTAIPRFETSRGYMRTRSLIKYVLAARMYVDGMPIRMINALLIYDFSHNMTLVTE